MLRRVSVRVVTAAVFLAWAPAAWAQHGGGHGGGHSRHGAVRGGGGHHYSYAPSYSRAHHYSTYSFGVYVQPRYGGAYAAPHYRSPVYYDNHYYPSSHGYHRRHHYAPSHFGGHRRH